MKRPENARVSLPLPGIRWRGFTLQMFLVTILPLTALLAGVVIVSQSLHRREMTSLVGDRNLRAVRAAAVSLEGQLIHLGYSLRVAARLLGDPADLGQLQPNIDLVEPEFGGGLALFTPAGELVAATVEADYWIDMPVKMAEFWEDLRHQPAERVSFSRSLFVLDDGNILALAGTTARSGNLLVGAFWPQRLIQEMLTGAAASPQSALLVSDGAGRTLFRSGSLPEASREGMQTGAAAALDLESGVDYYPSPDGDIVVAFAPIPPAGWALVIAEAWEQNAPPFLSTTQAAPLLLLPLLVLALAALWFGARQIVQPIQELEQLAARLARGEFQAIHQPVGGIEEIRRLQSGLERMAEDLQSAQSALRGYIGAITAGVENERRGLARELHDDTLQTLIALHQRVQLAALNAAGEEEASLRDLRGMIQKAIGNLRRLVRGMRPIYLEELGLAAALEMLANETNQANGVSVMFELQGEPVRLDAEVELALYRMAQEALNNASRHAQASRIEVGLDYGVDRLRLIIRDDGRGFELPAAREAFARQGHFGLLGLRERADLISADMRIETSPGQGTLVEVSLPIQRGSKG